MNEMFTMQDIFSQMFPFLSGISFDLGTVLLGILSLGFLIVGFDLIKAMLFGRYERYQYGKHADYYLSQAEEARMARDTQASGSVRWQEQDMIYRRFLKKSVDSRIKGWRR
jgi:hypothetical protein